MNVSKSNRIVVVTIGSLFLALILLASAALSRSYYERSKAEQLIEVASHLDLGVTSKQEVQKLTERLNRNRIGSPQSNGQLESVAFGFENGSALLLNMIPSKTVYVRFDFRDGILIRKELDYAESFGIAGSLKEEIIQQTDHDPLAFLRRNGRVLSVNRGAPPYPRDTPVQIVVLADNTSVSSERSKLDWRIDLNCMTKLQRCRDLRSVFQGALQEIS